MNEETTRTHLDLFSGIGGFALAAKWAGFETVAFCEQDKFCRGVLERHWPGVPCIDDVHELDGKEYRGIGLVTGGFPCQPFSHAGKRRGEEDDRAIWPQMARVIQGARPTWVLGENVVGLLTMGIDSVLSDLEGMGYSVQTFIVPACAVDAPHRRDRVWIVGNAERQRGQGGVLHPRDILSAQAGGAADSFVAGSQRPAIMAHSESEGGQCGETGVKGFDSQHEEGLLGRSGAGGGRGNWATEPGVGRVAHGIPNRVDRLKGLGNAIVPQVAYEFLRLMK